MSQDPHDEMLFYFGFNWWYFHVKHKEMLMINLIPIYCIHASTFFSIICAYQPFSVTHKNTEPPHHSLSLSRSHFSILLFGNPILEFITLDAAAPFLSSFAIRMSRWYDLSATQYILSTEATDIVQIHVRVYDMFNHFIKKNSWKQKLHKSSACSLSLLTQQLCLSGCVCPCLRENLKTIDYSSFVQLILFCG